jgi:hypothetical protein
MEACLHGAHATRAQKRVIELGAERRGKGRGERQSVPANWHGSAIEKELKKSDQEKGQGGKKRKEQVRDHDARRRVQTCLVGLTLGLRVIRDSRVEMPGWKCRESLMQPFISLMQPFSSIP